MSGQTFTAVESEFASDAYASIDPETLRAFFAPMEGRATLRVIEAMSRENDTSRTTWTVLVQMGGPTESATFELSLPWFEEVGKTTRRTYTGDALGHAMTLFARFGATDEQLHSLRDETLRGQIASLSALPPPVYEGDRPTLLPEAYLPRNRHRLLAPEAMALLERFRVVDAISASDAAAREDGIRETHRDVHEALAGEPCPTCQWCAEGGR